MYIIILAASQFTCQPLAHNLSYKNLHKGSLMLKTVILVGKEVWSGGDIVVGVVLNL